MATPTTAHMAQDLLARRGDLELQFVQHRSTGVVHIITPVDPDIDQPVRRLDADTLLDWAIGATPTLCGYTARRHLSGLDQGDKAISEFDRQLLCRSCHRALGRHAHRAFEYSEPDIEPGSP